MKKIAVLGCSGSIGLTTLNIIRRYPQEFCVEILVNNSNIKTLKAQIEEFKPKVAISVSAKFMCVNGRETIYDEDYLYKAENYSECDIVVNGIVGIAGLKPSMAVLSSNSILATANKESLVCAGELITRINGIENKIRPLDSEHSAVWQCFGEYRNNVEKIILTASGGAFRKKSKEEISQATAEEALKHPTWNMGTKVTIDCATMMNKGMELIEAKHLFGCKNIDVLQHNESIIHALVEMKDGMQIAGLSTPDMTLPIQYGLFYPLRATNDIPKLDLAKISSLHFGLIDEGKFPCLKIAKEVFHYGDREGTIMNASNEVLVQAYLRGQVGFYDISNYIIEALQKFGVGKINSIEEVLRIDMEVREYTYSILGGKK